MTSTTIITVNYNGITKSVAIFDGLSAEELSDVLCSTFFLKSGSIAGFQVDVSLNLIIRYITMYLLMCTINYNFILISAF